MNMLNTLLKMLRRTCLFACLVLISAPAFADPVYDLSSDAGRYIFFDDYKLTADSTWTHDGPAPTSFSSKGLLTGSNHVHKSGWSFLNCRMGRTQGGVSILPATNGNTFANGTNYCVYVENTTTAKILSPVFSQGVGTLYLDAISVYSDSPELSIYIATNMVNSLGDRVPIDASVHTNRQAIIWEPDGSPAPIEIITLTSGASYTPFKREINIRKPMCIKIERSNNNGTSFDNFYAAIDNIRVSEPPADVVMDKGNSPFNVYPSVNTNMSLQFRIDNVSGPNTTTYATRTNVLLVSRWNYLNQKITSWVTNKMQYVTGSGDGAGNGEFWQPLTPMMVFPDAGDLEYYFICYFNGPFYQSKNYTVYPVVTNLVLFPPENKSPRLYSAAGITAVSGTFTNNPFVFGLRLFPSSHETVTAMVSANGQTLSALPLSLVGTNKWQAKYKAVGLNTTNLLWYFEATGAYTNAYMTTSEKTYWQNTSPSGIQNGALPYGDNCGLTDNSITNQRAKWFGVKVTPGESSYVLLTLDTAKINYLAGRGEYQNFNSWVNIAAQNYFTDADDKEPKTSYSQTFSSGWPQSYYRGMSNWFFSNVAYTPAQIAAISVGPDKILNNDFFNAGSFQYVVERTPGNTLPDYSGTASQRRNQAVRLFGGSQPLGLGYYQGNDNQKGGIYGVGTITYKARLSRPIATDTEYNFNVGWRMTDMQRTNYVIRTSMYATAMSPENPSMSVIVYYQNMFKFYEYRITQEPDSRDLGTLATIVAGWDKRLRHEIWKWDGTRTPKLLASVVRTATAADGNWDVKLTDGSNFGTSPTEFHVYNPSSSATRMKVILKQTEISGWTLSNGATLVSGGVIEDATTPILYGTYGFHSADCSIWVPTMTINGLGSAGGEAVTTPASVLGTSSEWYIGTDLYKVQPGSGFISDTQSTTVKVLTGTTEAGWMIFTTNTVTGYAYQTFTETPKAWDNRWAKIQANGTVGVVIDGFSVGSWRGETITSSPSDNWKITEGWLSSNSIYYAHLDASQADSNLIQGVRSERIMGIGSLTFDYRVMNAPAQIKIQYTTSTYPQDDSNAGWLDITNMTFATAAGSWSNANYYLALAAATNVYVRIINNVTNRQAIVDLKNFVIWNNPTNSPNDWAAYNMKITNTETNKWWLDSDRSGYMNSGTVSNTAPTRNMDQYNPYIMAPRLTRGLGTISFLARAFTTNYLAGNTNTSISVYATTDAWDKNKPDAAWTKYYTFTNITNGFYRPFVYSHPTVPNDIKAVKLVVYGVIPLVGTPQRVCVDEIVVTEALYPRFDITGVKLLLPGTPNPIETKQPLEGEDIGIQAELTNVLLEPQNIQVYVTYVLGTNTWGVTNAPLAQQVTKTMTATTGRTYRTPNPFMTAGIPEQDKYNVIQYVVWATYDGNGFHTNYQSTATTDHFENPSWYFPVDFNRQGNSSTGALKSAWSPYYITYDVPPGSVWINELNLNENANTIVQKVFLNPYVEVAQPAWMDLTGWRLDILKDDYSVRLSKRIESRGALQPALNANGYGLFVIGPYDFEATSAVPAYPALSTTTTVHQSVQNIKGDIGVTLYPGGFRLVRPMGMYEHAIAYDWNKLYAGSGEVFVQNEPVPQTPFMYVGSEHYNGSLSYTGTVIVAAGQYARTDSTNTWAPGMANYNWTPGRANVGQTFPPAPTPGGSNVLVTSTFESPGSLMHGWQNNIRQNPLQFKMKKGQGTNFNYVADSWFRFYGITMNAVQMLLPAEQQTITNYTVVLNNIQTNINLLSDLRLAPSVIGSVTTPEMLAWLQQFGDKALATSYYGTSTTNYPIPFLNQYWLDMDPTQTNRLIFKNRSIVPDAHGLWLTVEMAKIDGLGTTNRVTHLLGDAMVTVWAKESGSVDPWQPFGQYWLSGRSFDPTNYLSRTRINAYTNSSAWFKWRLGENDQRLSTSELINTPL